MQMLKNIFGSKPKYYLELDEKEEAKAVSTSEKKAAAAPQNSTVASTPEKKAAAAPQNSTVAKPEKKAAPKSSRVSSNEQPFWVAAMYNTNNNSANSNGQMKEATFATDNLMPTVTKYRRRPGGSLAKFKDMAKTARTPRK